MKRIFLFAAILVSAVSCFKNTVWSESYTLRVTFEYPNEVYTTYFTADSLFFDKKADGFSWGGTVLAYKYKVVDEQFKGGFLMSYQKGLPAPVEEGAQVELDPTWRANAPAGAYDSKTYTVFYDNPDKDMMPDRNVIFTHSYYGTCALSSCMVNNTALVAQKVKEHFTLGDKLLLKATGYSGGTKTGEAEFVLADFNSQKDSIVSSWTSFDLSKLGAIEHVNFEVISPKAEVPGYFCMDELVANIALSSK